MTLGKSHEMTLTLNPHIPLSTHLVNCMSQSAKISKNFTVFTFSYRKVQVPKFAVKYVNVNPRSTFEQIIMGWSLRCCTPSFVEIGQIVLEKIFEGFLPYMGVAAVLVV